MLNHMKSCFITDESGAVTPDWVVLTGAIVGLGLVMLNAVGRGADDLADTAATSYATPRVTLAQASGDDGGLGGTEVDVSAELDAGGTTTTVDLNVNTGDTVAY